MMETSTYRQPPGSCPDPVDTRLFRAVCGRFVTGVTVVTTLVDDRPAGLTINSFTPVSLAPPLILFCLNKTSGMRKVLARTGGFAVNILAEDQEQVSRTFAGTAGPRFTDLRTHPAITGAPVLDDSLAYLDCRYVNEVDAGDHGIVIGEVVDLGVLRDDSNPLTFFRSSHARLGVRW
jgi:3-hydroxy-9,10-secoandrosta-1,3,5(10)-triene-9,17-dione monooxygenase reductase component